MVTIPQLPQITGLNDSILFEASKANQSGHISLGDLKSFIAVPSFDGDYNSLTNKPTIPVIPTLAPVATSGLFADLTSIPSTFPSDWSLIANKPSFFDGNYNNLSNKPIIPTVPTIATVGLTGNYSDLTGKPALFSGSYSDLSNKPTLFSGSYTDLTNKPTIPTVAVKSTTPPLNPVAGQEWDQIDANGFLVEKWTWNSEFSAWLAREVSVSITATASPVGASSPNQFAPKPFPKFLLTGLFYSSSITTTADSLNKWDFNLVRVSNTTETPIASITFDSIGTFEGLLPINQKSSDMGVFQQFRLRIVKTGTPSSLNSPHVSLLFRRMF